MHDVNSFNGLGTGASQPVPLQQSISMLFEIVRFRAALSPSQVAFRFAVDDEKGGDTSLTYAELDARARSVAQHLEQAGAAGQRVLLVAKPGLDFVTSFFGCLFAGAVAVPAYPPDPFRLHRTLPRLQTIISKADTRFMIASDLETHPLREHFGHRAWDAASLGHEESSAWVRPPNRPDQVAVLQYTSGSTGAPRGVMLTHANILSNLQAIGQALDVPNAVGVHWLPPYHDLGLIGGVLTPCYSGRETILMSPLSFMQRPLRWLQTIDHYRATTTGAPNFGFEQCVRKIKSADCEGLDLSCLQVVVSGAERVRPSTLRAFSEKFAPFGFRPSSVVAAFGLAEATVMVSAGEIHRGPRVKPFCARALSLGQALLSPDRDDAAIELISCGHPVQHTTVRIVDPDSQRELPAGGVGEIWVNGPGVGEGYWAEPAATAELFHARLSHGCPDEQYLRTGDLGFVHEGELYITGRDKELLILGGRNYYPQDIEQALSESHEVLRPEAAAVFSIETDSGEQWVAVFEVRRPQRFDLNEILHGLRRAAVEHFELSPQAVVLIPAGTLPKTSSGKTRRIACRNGFLDGTLKTLAQWTEDASRTVSPRLDEPCTETERRLAGIWENVLNAERVCRQDDFFQLGGQSLALSEMLLQVQQRWHTKLDVRTAFENATLEAMARILDQSAAASPVPAIPPAQVVEHRLSFAQEGFWFMEQLGNGQGSAAVVAATITLRGVVDDVRLRKAMDGIVRRHAALRTGFQTRQGIPYQVVAPAVHVPIEFVDLSQLNDEQRELQRLQLRDRCLQSRFDLTQPPLLRCCLCKVSGNTFELLLVAHHLICDELSLGIVLRELAASFGDRQDAPGDAIEFVDFAHWERQRYNRHEFADDLDYWSRRLDGCVERLELPCDFAPPRDEVSRPGRRRIKLDAETGRTIRSLARESGVTPYMVFLTVFQELLAHYGGQQDINIAVPVARRDHPQLKSLVGCLMNTVVTRRPIQAGETLREELLRTRELLLEDLSHADVPFEKVVETVRPERTWGTTPLAQVLLLNRDAQFPDSMRWTDEIEMCRVEIDASGIAGFDMALIVNSDPSTSSSVEMAYNVHLFLPQTIDYMLELLSRLLRSATLEPDRPLDILLSDSIPRATEAVGQAREIECETVFQQFQRQVVSIPQRPAVEFRGSTWTYAQLKQRVDEIAQLLNEHWVEPGDRVAISLSRSLDLVAAMLATWKLGAAYVPIARKFPDQRIKDILEDCQPRVLLADAPSRPGPAITGELAVVMVDAQEEYRGAARADAVAIGPSQQRGSSTAYVIYTSGSTGGPKGVAVAHRAVVNFLQSMASVPGLSNVRRVLAHTTVSFDISLLELFLPLTTGGAVVLAGDTDVSDGKRLRRFIESTSPDMIQATPSAFRLLLDSGWRPTAQHRLLCGGESLTCDLAELLLTHAADLWNVYGPTETTVWSTIFKVPRSSKRTRSGTIPIGGPIQNTRLRVVDPRNKPVPLGAIGELWIGGDGLAQGYWNRPELTKQKFGPSNGESPYFRTGDLVRWRGDGSLEFISRTDDQVKVRGFRVELGEVEATLQNHARILEAAVQAHDGQRLCAYYVVAAGHDDGGDAVTPAELCRHLRQRLPEYMIPSIFVCLPQLPRTAAGKIARRDLTLPDETALQRSLPFRPPETPLEQQIAELWQQMLNVPRVGKDDSFFELGGHSLIATQMLARLQDQSGASLALRDLYEGPSVGDLASRIVARHAECLDEDQLRRLLTEVDGLSDDQACSQLRDLAGPAAPDDSPSHRNHRD